MSTKGACRAAKSVAQDTGAGASCLSHLVQAAISVLVAGLEHMLHLADVHGGRPGRQRELGGVYTSLAEHTRQRGDA